MSESLSPKSCPPKLAWKQPVGSWRERGATPVLLRVGMGLSVATQPAAELVDTSGYTLWHYWAHSPRPQETLQGLIQRFGTDLLDRPASNGAHPWHYLLLEGNAAALEAWAALNGTPAEPPCVLSTGDTFSHCLAWSAEPRLLNLFSSEELLSINAPDAQGVLPLTIAVHRGSPAFVHSFLMAGADPTIGDPQGKTALHHAAQYGDQDLFMLLEDMGADPEQPDKNGIDPSSILKARRNLTPTDTRAIREHWLRRQQHRLPF